MRALLLNRIATVLAFVGIFIAGTLSIAKFLNVIPPCGEASHGCARVEADPSSVWFGVPVAVIGLVTYLILATLSILRQRKGLEQSKQLMYAGYAISAVGMLTSAGLTYYAITQIGATCLWCIGSAIAMTGLFVLHAVLAQMDLPLDVPVTASDFKLNTGLGALVVLGLGFMTVQLKNSGEALPKSNLFKKMEASAFITKDSHVEGPSDAPVTIIEFGDLFCPSCRKYYPLIHNELSKYPGKFRFVFHNLPLHNLPGHQYAFSAAVLSEIAAENGNFFTYLNQAYGGADEPKDLTPFIEIARRVGVKMDKWDVRATDENDPAFQKVYADMEFAAKIGVSGTPTYFMYMPGVKEPQARGGEQMYNLLQDPSFVEKLRAMPPSKQ